MPVTIYEEECKECNIDEVRVKKIANRLRNALLDAQKLGLQLFGGSGDADLRVAGTGLSYSIGVHTGRIVVAHLGVSNVDGGDGGCGPGPDGLLRGE